jgi:hypothetical protein
MALHRVQVVIILKQAIVVEGVLNRVPFQVSYTSPC